MPIPIIIFGIFKLAVIASGAGFIARIRRADGNPILYFGQDHAAIGTKLCATETEAVEEAKAIIRRRRLDSCR